MKLNWGTGITIFIIIFVLAISLMIFRVAGEKIELVTPDYYEKELKYQDDINALQKAANLGEKLTIIEENNVIKIALPGIFAGDTLSANIHVYRPSDKSLDKTFNVTTDTLNHVIIPANDLKSGMYKLTLDVIYNNEHYKFKSDLYIEQ